MTALDQLQNFYAQISAGKNPPSPANDPYALTSVVTAGLAKKLDLTGNSSNTTVTLKNGRSSKLSDELIAHLNYITQIAISVTQFGAKVDNQTIDTKAIQDTVNYAAGLGYATNILIPGMAVIDATIVVPEGAPITFVGLGLGTGLRQINSSAGGISFSNVGYYAHSAGVRNMTIEAGAGYQTANFFGQGSTGTGILAQRHGSGFSLQCVDINGFANLIQYRSVHNTENYNIKGRGFSGVGISIDAASGDGPAAGNSFIGGVLANDGWSGANNSIGIDIQSSGGEWFKSFDIVVCNNSVRLAPPAGKQVAYCWFHDVLADTAITDGWVFDGSQGSVIRIDVSSSWGSYCGANGIVTKGGNLRTVKLHSFGGRQCGQRGWYHQGGYNIEFHGPDFQHNSRGNNAVYPGVEIADGAIGENTFSIIGGTSGNNQGGGEIQGSAIKFAGTASGFIISEHNFTTPGGGKPRLDIADWTKLSNYVMSKNLPLASGVSRSDCINSTMYASFIPDASAGITAYLVAVGTGANGGLLGTAGTAPFFADTTRLITDIYLATTSAPGAGKSITCQLVVNGSPVGPIGTLSGASSFSVRINPQIVVNAGDTYEVKIVASPGTTAQQMRGYIRLEA